MKRGEVLRRGGGGGEERERWLLVRITAGGERDSGDNPILLLLL